MNTFIFDHKLANIDPNTVGATNAPNYELPVLPPPKRFLMPESMFYTSSDTKMEFIPTQTGPKEIKRNHAANVVCTKLRITGEKLQITRIYFVFDREKDIMYEKKDLFQMVTYIVKKKALYFIHNRKTPAFKNKKRYHKCIQRVGLNIPYVLSNATFDASLFNRWLKAMRLVTHSEPKETLLGMLVGHKTGVYMKEPLKENIDHYINRQWTPKEKRQRLYKFLPVLADTGSTNKALKQLTGNNSKTLLKLLHTITVPQNMMVNDEYALLPKSLKHYLNQTMRTKSIEDVIRLVRTMSNYLDRWKVPENVGTNWVKTMIRLDIVIDWFTWKDMYYMAGRLGIRIRPIKFVSEHDIGELHDQLAILARERKITSSELPATFMAVKIPAFEQHTVIQLISPKELRDMGQKMENCIGAYAHFCADGEAILFSITKHENDETWAVEYSGRDYHMVQASKGRGHAKVDEKDKEKLEEFGEKLKEINMLPYKTLTTLLQKEKAAIASLERLGRFKDEGQIGTLRRQKVSSIKRELKILKRINDAIQEDKITPELSKYINALIN